MKKTCPRNKGYLPARATLDEPPFSTFLTNLANRLFDSSKAAGRKKKKKKVGSPKSWPA